MTTPELQPRLDAHIFSSRLKLKHLTLLRNVSELQTLRKGAAASNMTQPAATKLIQELEELFGVALFHRDRRGMKLTLHGERVRQYVDILLTDIDKMRDEVDMLSAGVTGCIRLGVVPSLAPELLTQSIVRMLKDRPKVRFVIQEASTTTLLANLNRNELDMVLGRVIDANQTQNMQVTDIYAESFSIVCAPQHALSTRRNLPWSALAQCSWIFPPTGTPLRHLVDNIFTRNNVMRPGATVESSSFEQMRNLISHSDMLGVVPRSMSLQSQARGDLTVLKDNMGDAFAPISLICRSDIDQPPLNDIFSRVLREAATAMNLK